MIPKGYNWWVIRHFVSSCEVKEWSVIQFTQSTEFLETEKIYICCECVLKIFEEFDCQEQWSWKTARGSTFYSQRLSSWEAR